MERRCFLNIYPIDSQNNSSHQWTNLRNLKTIKNVSTFHTCYFLANNCSLKVPIHLFCMILSPENSFEVISISL